MNVSYEDELKRLRAEINETDRQLLAAFERRRSLCAEVAQLKRESGRAVYDAEREGELLLRLSRESGEPETVRTLYNTILMLSRRSQRQENTGKTAAGDDKTAGDVVSTRTVPGDTIATRTVPGDTWKTAAYGLIGSRVDSSFSPALHARLGCPDYALWSLAPQELGVFLKQSFWRGLNVTKPYKKSVIPYCARLSRLAAVTGAVNTLRREADGSLTGYNTDAAGFLYTLKRISFAPEGKKALVLGSGGAGSMAKAVLERRGARVVTVSRSGPVDYRRLKEHGDAALLVNATPVGMFPFEGECPVNLDELPGLEAVVDFVYRPLRTRLILEAEKRGLKYSGGLPMLTVQAMQAEMIWKGDDSASPSEAEAEVLIRQVEQEYGNIVLIGMPGAGKSTQARILGAVLHRPVFDSDAAFLYAQGMTAGEYIRLYGEPAFREEENALLRELSRKNGIILATGGGTVLREENRQLLKQNGRILFLNRNVDELSTLDRPLSGNRERMLAMEKSRVPIYRSLADAEVLVEGRKNETLQLILQALDMTIEE